MPLGVPLPAEAAGTLREPTQWSKQTSASILMGYEIAVTPLQLVTAYAAIANGGELLEPHLVKEVRSADGKVLYRAEPRRVRRVMSLEVSRTVQQMLLAVVREGTATKADLATFEVAGKSGTARRTSGSAGYVAGNYTASFVGLFPGNDPQYVVLVKLDNPKGAHYAGGDIAAPVTRIVLRAALSARDAALDREGLAASEKSALAEAESGVSRTTSGEESAASTEPARFARRNDSRSPDRPAAESYDPGGNMTKRDASERTASYVIELPSSLKPAPAAILPRAVPDVRGLSVREAVRALHGAGFRVHILASSPEGTLPVAGTLVAPGTIVQLSRPLE
jgi:cell division protein FtsI (penicillin-binding protein 3)